MSEKIHIVDYGIGNLYSVARAVEACGGVPQFAAAATEIAQAERLILPGVGAFRNGMEGLRAKGLDEAVIRFAARGRPLLGICLGMQMLATRSFEFGEYAGLDLIPGEVRAIPFEGHDGSPHKIPFIGWVGLTETRPVKFASTPLDGLSAEDSVYLVHSYHFVPDDASDLLAVYDYDGVAIAAAVARDNIVGCQFHPEKSGAAGLAIVRAFLAT